MDVINPTALWGSLYDTAVADIRAEADGIASYYTKVLSYEIKAYIDEAICEAFKKYSESIGEFISDQELNDILNG